MVLTAAGGHRRLLQSPQPRRRLARVEDDCPGPGDRLDIARRQRRDPGEVAEEVERRPLRRKQPHGRPARQHDLGRHLLPPLPLDHKLVDVLHPALPHRLHDSGKPEDNPGLLLHDPSPRPRPLGHGGSRGDVADADVLGQRPLY